MDSKSLTVSLLRGIAKIETAGVTLPEPPKKTYHH